jgi:hypothetical protein
MTRWRVIFAAMLTLTFVAIGAIGAIGMSPASAQGAAENTVTGGGSTADGFFAGIAVDAHSDASGANAGGTVSFSLLGLFNISGPVTCLAVNGNQAVIGFNDVTSGFGPSTVVVVDNGSTGTPPDTFSADLVPTDCLSEPSLPASHPFGSGDLAVHGALPLISKEQCKVGGWQNLTDPEGQPFKNQGACIKFVNAP